jgi:hypothetical protein
MICVDDDLDASKRTWLEGHLAWAAQRFGVELAGKPVHGPRIRSVGARVRQDGRDAWLRVVFEDPDWGIGDYLGANVAANEIRDVPKPEVTRWEEWDDQDRRLRGELMTYVPEPPVSDTMLLSSAPDLPENWFDTLARALDALARHPMPRNGVDLDDLNNGALAYFGLSVNPAAVIWTTAHTDLHWANVTAPILTILDWETWGRAPAGYDAATLYCTSLLDPTTCHRIRRNLAAFLDGPAGELAVVLAAVRLLRFVDGGELTDLGEPLRARAEHAARALRGTDLLGDQSTGKPAGRVDG